MSVVILPTDTALQNLYQHCQQMSQLEFDIYELTRIVLDGLKNYHDHPFSFKEYVKMDAFEGEPGALTQPDCQILNKALWDYYEYIFDLLVRLGCYEQESGVLLYPFFSFYRDNLVISNEPMDQPPNS